MIHWNSAQYVAVERFPCRMVLNFLLATSLESASPNARVIAVLKSSHPSYLLFPSVMEGFNPCPGISSTPRAGIVDLFGILVELVGFEVEFKFALH
jgi:hypothetical protein